MLFRLPEFRFRSPQRDKETDQARLAGIHHAARSAVTNAEHELSGIRARLEKARQTAAMLLGSLDSGGRDDAHGSELRGAEERLLVAERRMVQLKAHLAALQRIESALNIELNS